MVLILVGFKFSAWYQVWHKRSENGYLDKYEQQEDDSLSRHPVYISL